MIEHRGCAGWILFLGLIGWLSAGPVRGDIIDDILSVTTAARDRATEARNRAIEARDRATEARNSANEIRDNVRNGLAALNNQIRDLITEAVEDMQLLVERELGGRDEFIADGGCSIAVCQPFRQDLVNFLQDLQSVMNLIFSIAELDDMQLNFDQEIQLINLLPGRALFPLYRILSGHANLVGPGLLQRMSDLVADLIILEETLRGTGGRSLEGPRGQSPLEKEVEGCTFVMNHYDDISTAKKGVSLHAIMFKIMSSRLKSTGETTAEGANPGIHGYINVTIKDNKVKSVGETLGGISDALSKVAEFADDKLRDCVHYTAQLDAQTSHQDIMNAIDDIKTLAAARGADLDGNGHVDLADFSLFQLVFDSTIGP